MPVKLAVPLISTAQMRDEVDGRDKSVLVGVALDTLVKAASLKAMVYLVRVQYCEGPVRVSPAKVGFEEGSNL